MSDSRDPRNIYRRLGYPDPVSRPQKHLGEDVTLAEYLDGIVATGAQACLDVMRRQRTDGTQQLLALMAVLLPSTTTHFAEDAGVSMEKLVKHGYLWDDTPGQPPSLERKSPD